MKQMNGGKQSERGQELVKGSGHGRQKVDTAGTQPAEQGNCRRTQPADSPPGSGLKTNGPLLADRAARTQQLPQMTSASRRAGKWGECKGVGTEEGGLRPT